MKFDICTIKLLVRAVSEAGALEPSGQPGGPTRGVAETSMFCELGRKPPNVALQTVIPILTSEEAISTTYVFRVANE